MADEEPISSGSGSILSQMQNASMRALGKYGPSALSHPARKVESVAEKQGIIEKMDSQTGTRIAGISTTTMNYPHPAVSGIRGDDTPSQALDKQNILASVTGGADNSVSNLSNGSTPFVSPYQETAVQGIGKSARSMKGDYRFSRADVLAVYHRLAKRHFPRNDLIVMRTSTSAVDNTLEEISITSPQFIQFVDMLLFSKTIPKPSGWDADFAKELDVQIRSKRSLLGFVNDPEVTDAELADMQSVDPDGQRELFKRYKKQSGTASGVAGGADGEFFGLFPFQPPSERPLVRFQNDSVYEMAVGTNPLQPDSISPDDKLMAEIFTEQQQRCILQYQNVTPHMRVSPQNEHMRTRWDNPLLGQQ